MSQRRRLARVSSRRAERVTATPDARRNNCRIVPGSACGADSTVARFVKACVEGATGAKFEGVAVTR
jgi:hypothetical protein